MHDGGVHIPLDQLNHHAAFAVTCRINGVKAIVSEHIDMVHQLSHSCRQSSFQVTEILEPTAGAARATRACIAPFMKIKHDKIKAQAEVKTPEQLLVSRFACATVRVNDNGLGFVCRCQKVFKIQTKIKKGIFDEIGTSQMRCFDDGIAHVVILRPCQRRKASDQQGQKVFDHRVVF